MTRAFRGDPIHGLLSEKLYKNEIFKQTALGTNETY